MSIIETSQKEHYAILDAIKKKDLGLMTEALTFHLKQTKTRIMQGLSESLHENGSRLSTYHSFEDIKDKTNF